jgi:tRNA threonylcarbamoyladenosine modification (KEOPS) complex  Pcc1 subunit
MRYSAVIKIKDEEGLKDLFLDFEGETDRSSVKISEESGYIVFSVTAKDSVALRATLNSITKIFTAYENMRG